MVISETCVVQHAKFQHRSRYEIARFMRLFWAKMEFFNDGCNYTRGVQNMHHVKQTYVAHAVLIVLILIAAFMFMFLAGFGSGFENITRQISIWMLLIYFLKAFHTTIYKWSSSDWRQYFTKECEIYQSSRACERNNNEKKFNVRWNYFIKYRWMGRKNS